MLLFCVVDCMGAFDGLKPSKTLEVLTKEPFGLDLDKNKIQYLKQVYRHGLVHEATIRDYAALLPDGVPPVFRFSAEGEPRVSIALRAFYDATAKAWSC